LSRRGTRLRSHPPARNRYPRPARTRSPDRRTRSYVEDIASAPDRKAEHPDDRDPGIISPRPFGRLAPLLHSGPTAWPFFHHAFPSTLAAFSAWQSPVLSTAFSVASPVFPKLLLGGVPVFFAGGSQWPAGFVGGFFQMALPVFHALLVGFAGILAASFTSVFRLTLAIRDASTEPVRCCDVTHNFVKQTSLS